MKKAVKRKQKKSNKSRIIPLFLLFVLFGVIAIILPRTDTKKLSYGAVPFTPVPAKPNLQLEWFLVPTGSSNTPAQSQPGITAQPMPTKPASPTQPPKPQQPVVTNKPQTPFMPVVVTPGSIGRFQPVGLGPTAPPSNGQLCSVGNNSGKTVTGNCYCADLTVTCKNGVGYGKDGRIYPGVNPCGTSSAPGSGRYCVEKPVIYLYPTVPTTVAVQVITSGSVVVSDPLYPQGGWKNVLAEPDGTLHYNGKDYSELFYESSVTDFQKPPQGVTILKAMLAEKLSALLDRLGLVGKEKQEFLSFWVPQLQAMPTKYIFFSILTPSAKAGIDTVDITPKPDTQIAFIAYFKAVSQPAPDTLQLPPAPKRQGFVSVEWGGVIGK